MPVFAVSYDLNRSKNYERLWGELERLGAFAVQKSLWLVKRPSLQAEVLAHLKDFVDEDDFLMVMELPRKPSFTKAKGGTNAWLSKNYD